jgi:trehalose 6-phosphate phosphatase
VEDKGLTASLHYRGMDEGIARAELDAIAERARAEGFVARYGRKVLELLPPLEANKGTAVRSLLAEHDLVRGLYAGDDTTDLDAFAALDELALGVRVAVTSAEGPPELRDRADVVLDAQADVLGLLRSL